MSVWLLTAFFCVRASAAVVETGGAIAPVAPVSGSIGAALGAGAALSPILVVPDASLLAPSLNTGAIKAFPDQDAEILPALPAAAAAPSPRDSAPLSVSGNAALRAAAVDRRRGSDAEALLERDSLRLDAEGAAALGRRIFDRAADRALLAAGPPSNPALAVAAGSSFARREKIHAALAPADGSVDGERPRDAVAAPIPTAAAPGTAFSFFRIPGSPVESSRSVAADAPSVAAAYTITFERLSLELGEGLVVEVRAALGFAPAAAIQRPFDGAAERTAAAFPAPRRSRAPITSTEWLERRGLLESLSVSEAAASQAAALIPAPALAPSAGLAPATPPESAVVAAVSAPVFDPARPRVPALAWWSLAFLPALLVPFKEFL